MFCTTWAVVLDLGSKSKNARDCKIDEWNKQVSAQPAKNSTHPVLILSSSDVLCLCPERWTDHHDAQHGSKGQRSLHAAGRRLRPLFPGAQESAKKTSGRWRDGLIGLSGKTWENSEPHSKRDIQQNRRAGD